MCCESPHIGVRLSCPRIQKAIKNYNRWKVKMGTQKSLFYGIVIAACSFLSNSALAEVETEENNNFSNRNILTPGTTIVNGVLPPGSSSIDLSSVTPDFVFNGTLAENTTNFHTISDQKVEGIFFATTDNFSSGIDTVLGTFDEANRFIVSDDDSSPFGNGLASALGGAINLDGSINLGVTGFPNTDFDGTEHPQIGDYELNIYLGFDSIDSFGFSGSDVDFFSFTGLTPGALMNAEITSAEFDTTLGLFDSDGNLIASDDDSGDGLLSLLEVAVSAEGVVNLAVSGYGDFVFLPDSHDQSGEYELTLTAVPTPAAVWLFGAGMLGLAGLGHRKNQT